MFKQPTADDIASCVFAAYTSLPPRGKPAANEWTVLAAFVASSSSAASMGGGGGANGLRVISLASGTKCIGRGSLRSDGLIVNDSHAEVLARRALCRALLSEMEAHATGCILGPNGVCALSPDLTLLRHSECEGFRGAEDFCDVSSKVDARYFSLRNDIRLHLYISDTPCGEAASYSDCDGNGGMRRTGAKMVDNNGGGGAGSAVEGAGAGVGVSTTTAISSSSSSSSLRTKSGRSDLPLAARTRSLSCSDKVARWASVGLQSALVSHFLAKPIFLSSLIISANEGISYMTPDESLLSATRVTDKTSSPQFEALSHAIIGRNGTETGGGGEAF